MEVAAALGMGMIPSSWLQTGKSEDFRSEMGIILWMFSLSLSA